MGLQPVEYLGWAATAVFVSSYFCGRAETLKRVQMAGAAMWIAYGVVIGASPVIVANVLVLGAAAWTRSATGPSDGSPSIPPSAREPT
jgi:hypothetical protein